MMYDGTYLHVHPPGGACLHSLNQVILGPDMLSDCGSTLIQQVQWCVTLLFRTLYKGLYKGRERSGDRSAEIQNGNDKS
jgi:hypothetical protein